MYNTLHIGLTLHETLSKKRTVICENTDATSLDNQVIDRSG